MTLTSDSPASITVSRALSLALGQGGELSVAVNEAGELVITGSEFSEKINAKPFFYVDPGNEGVVTTSPLSRTSLDLSSYNIGQIDTETKYGTASMRAEGFGSSPDYLVPGAVGWAWGDLRMDSDGAGDHIRVMSRHRRNFDGLDAYDKWQALNPSAAAWNVKRWRWWSDENPVIKNDVVFALGQQNSADGAPRITWENSGGSTYYPESARLVCGMQKDAWISELIDIRQSSAPGVADAMCRHIANGYELVIENVESMNDDGNDSKYIRFVMEQWQYLYTDSSFPFRLWHDFIYVDDTPHAVVLSDSPVWGATDVQLDPVIPLSWTNTQIIAKPRCSITGKYLYVIDGDGGLVNNQGVAV